MEVKTGRIVSVSSDPPSRGPAGYMALRAMYPYIHRISSNSNTASILDWAFGKL
jgi:hypothetical protein